MRVWHLVQVTCLSLKSYIGHHTSLYLTLSLSHLLSSLLTPTHSDPFLFTQFIREDGEDQVGALDGEDIDGFVGEESPLFRQALQHSQRHLQEDTQDDQDRIIKWIKDMQERRGYSEQEEKEEVGREMTEREREENNERRGRKYVNLFKSCAC